MKIKFYTFILAALIISGYAGEKRILIEVLTNSHCPLCVPAYSAINSYLAGGQNKTKVDYIYYHMVFPYSDDPLYQANKADANIVNSFYGPFSSTPKAFFNGEIQSNNYSNWNSVIDSYLSGNSPVDINLSGVIADNQSTFFNLKVSVERNGNITNNDLEMKIVVVEDVNYQGRNGVAGHTNVMRKIVNKADLNISNGSKIEINQQISISDSWNRNNISVVVFVQSKSAKTVYQSATMDYAQLNITDINESVTPVSFNLKQNYPNPFNPSTTIQYSLEKRSYVKLTVYSILGELIETLVDKEQNNGLYSVNFNGDRFPSGIYFYKLSAGNKNFVKKMILIK